MAIDYDLSVEVLMDVDPVTTQTGNGTNGTAESLGATSNVVNDP
jgi:hypothetical protein